MNNLNQAKEILPTVESVEKMVDQIIDLNEPDKSAKTFIDLLLIISGQNADGHRQDLAMAAAERAYLHTKDFTNSFRKFARLPEASEREEKREKAPMSSFRARKLIRQMMRELFDGPGRKVAG